MRKSTRSLLILAVVAIALGATVYAELVRERGLAPQPLTALDPASVTHLEIRCRSCATRVFDRVDGVWWMQQPHAAKANPEAVARLLTVVRASVRTRAKLASYDAAKLGLDPPQFTVVANDTHIDIGGEDPIDHDRYVRIGDELLRVPDRFSARLLEAPESELLHPGTVH
ncbi:MAG: DUF4340 domain-containing protein [Xanthomonadales bacterium PRO7]|nr:DUF4340 domain-containing protein [Xanthomonadales bacterium PRO7]HMM55995.1 DUF4340 domain-containing protein [Rudaea sp.]